MATPSESFVIQDVPASEKDDDVDSLPSISSSLLDSDDEHDDAQEEWERSLQQLQMLLTMVVIPFAGKYFGRQFAYWSMYFHCIIASGRSLLHPFPAHCYRIRSSEIVAYTSIRLLTWLAYQVGPDTWNGRTTSRYNGSANGERESSGQQVPRRQPRHYNGAVLEKGLDAGGRLNGEGIP